MAVIKKRNNRRDGTLKNKNNKILIMKAPGWKWSVNSNVSHRRTQDFTHWRDNGRMALGRELRDAHWILSTQESTSTTRGRFLSLSYFWKFLEEHDPKRQINTLIQIDLSLYEYYSAWLQRQLATSGKKLRQTIASQHRLWCHQCS